MARTDGIVIAEYNGEGAYGYATGFRLSRRADGRLRLEQWGFAWRGNDGGAGRSVYLFPAEAIPDSILSEIAEIAEGRGDWMLTAHQALDIIPEAAWRDAKRTRAEGFFRA